jgi:hypothetical protein
LPCTALLARHPPGSKETRMITRGCDDRTNLDRDCDGCLRSVATPGMGVGTGRCRWSRRGRWDRRRDHRVPTAGLRGVPRRRPAGVRNRMLLGIPAGVRRSRPRRRLYGAAGAGLPRLCPAAATGAGLCRTAAGAAARCSASAKMKRGRSGPTLLGDPSNRGGQEQTSGDWRLSRPGCRWRAVLSRW